MPKPAPKKQKVERPSPEEVVLSGGQFGLKPRSHGMSGAENREPTVTADHMGEHTYRKNAADETWRHIGVEDISGRNRHKPLKKLGPEAGRMTFKESQKAAWDCENCDVHGHKITHPEAAQKLDAAWSQRNFNDRRR